MAYTPKRAGSVVASGRSCAVVESSKWVGPVKTPVGGQVLAVNQDPLGKQAKMAYNGVRYQVWTKELYDGSMAVAIFNIGKDNPVEAFNWNNDARKLNITVGADQIGVSGTHKVRDLWKQRDIGTFNEYFGAQVPWHGVILLKIWPDDGKR